MKIVEIMSSDPITVGVTDPLAVALGTLEELDIRHLPVLKDGRVVGVVSDRDLLESTGWMWNEEDGKAPVVVEDILQTGLVTVAPGDTVADVANRLVEWGVGCVPVVEDGHLRGIVTEIDVLRSLVAAGGAGAGPGTSVRVEERMTTDVLTLDLGSTAADAMELMRGRSIRHLPVVDGVNVVGLVSDRDLRAILGRALPSTTPVREFMSTDVQTIAPDDDLVVAAEQMARLKIGGLPVVERDAVIGMITITDLLEHCASVMG